MVECEICLEEYPEGHLELHRQTCVLRLLYRCSVCHEDYVSREGLWNHLYVHGIVDDSKDFHYQEIKAKYKLYQCAKCNDQRGFSERTYRMHVDNLHENCQASNFSELLVEPAICNVKHITSNDKHEKQPLEEQTTKVRITCPQKTEEHESSQFGSLLPGVNEEPQTKRQTTVPQSEDIELELDIKVEDTKLQSQEYDTSNEDSGGPIATTSQPRGHKSELFVAGHTECHEEGIDEEHQEHEEKFLVADKKVTHSTECHICEQKFGSRQASRYHRIRYHSERQHKCSFCQKKFYYTSQLQRHEKGCSELRCHVCDIKFSLRCQLANHNLDKHGIESELAEVGGSSEDENAIKQNPHAEKITSLIEDATDSRECPICGHKFRTRNQLSYHKAVRHTKPRHECSFCQKKFHFTNDLRNHEKGCSELRCHICDIKLRNRTQLVNHNIDKHGSTSKNDRIKPATGLQNEIKVMEKRQEKEKTVSTKCQNNVESSECRFKCSICGLSFGNKGRLKYHKTILHTEQRLECSLCKRKFYFTSHLRDHQKTCSSLRCHRCDIKFCNRSQLDFHNIEKHPHGSESEYGRSEAEAGLENGIKVNEERVENEGEMSTECQNKTETSESRFECSICRINLENKTRLKYHKKVFHTEPRHECSYCKKRFYFTSHLRRHEKICSSLSCDRSDVKLHNRDQLVIHNIAKHPDDGNSKDEDIPEDEVKLDHQGKRSEAVVSDEAGNQIWSCSICNLRFATKHRRRNHMTKAHREPQHKCSFCQKMFYKLSVCCRHATACSKLRCHECGIMFTTRFFLNNHNMKEHSQGGQIDNLDAADVENLEESQSVDVPMQ